MQTAGIICEYNPFHSGHKRQIDLLHSSGYDCVVCVMSGNYTQRGELAIFDKYTRANAAVMGGADLVLELPFPFSSMSAEAFAASGVHILASLGINTLCFGSECGNKKQLERAADAVISPSFSMTYAKLTKSGLGSAAAYFEAIKALIGDDIRLLSNDILGISYIAAIKRSNYCIDILAIKRDGAAYNEKELQDGILPSASAIREIIKNPCTNLSFALDRHIPKESLKVFSDAINCERGPVSRDKIEREILSFFKLMTPQEIFERACMRSGGGGSVAEDGCGICERLCNTAGECFDFKELLSRASTSKYTDARINRVILFSLLGVSDKLTHSMPEYTSLLAANSKGREFLSKFRKSNTFDIITKPADAPDTAMQKRLSEAADMLYTYAFPENIDRDLFVKMHPFMLK